ncbi:glycosyltransferase family 21 protein [Pseudohyphozyma bogoriensis]|nr:glycosyltransferase family 21 protein [Pseudohyphozyma bogoriensis]
MISTILAGLGLGWYSLMWTISCLGLAVAKSRYNKPPQPSSLSTASGDDVPGVSILRPLRGLDCNLYENLESSFLQLYPKFEIIFSVADEADPSIPIVQELIRKYPKVDAKLVIGEEIVGVNPKINNLIRPYRQAAYDILWVLDSNVLSSTSALSASVSLLITPPLPGHKPIGLVHHLPFAIYPDDNLGSRVEQVFLCSTHAKMYLAINWVAIESCVTGKSCLYRKSDLERAAMKKKEEGKGHILADGQSGLAAFGKYLGEDNMIGEAIWHELGMRHAMGGEIAGNAVGSMNFKTFFRRRVRWIRVRKYMVIASTLIEPLTECFICGLVGAFSLRHFFSLPFWFTYPVHVAAWFSIDCLIFTALSNASPSPSRSRPAKHDGPGLDYLKAWFTRETMALPIWLFAMLGNTVGWRDNGETYKVQTDGSVKLVGENDQEAFVERALAATRRRMGDRESYVRLSPDAENAV